MTLEGEKIVSCTMAELHWIYLDGDWDELYSWDDFVRVIKASGVTVEEEQ